MSFSGLADKLNAAMGASRAAVNAGYGIVGDLFEIVPELVKQLG